MGQILLEFDNQLKQSDIIVPLTNSSHEESGDNYVYNKSGYQQTLVYGIMTPLIQINNIVVDFIDVIEFKLSSTGTLPKVVLLVRDRNNLIKTLDTPGNDNELRIQILPQFDNAYKKINLTFYITRTNIEDDTVEISAAYKIPKLTSTQFECLGELDTYSVFRQVAKSTQLGFATNCEQMNDKRYMYCDHKSYQDLLNSEITKSQSDETHIYDWWVDLWNNINLVNIYERYNTIDPDEEMMIWVSGQKVVNEGLDQPQAVHVPALLNNHPGDGHLELKVNDYEIVNKQGAQLSNGTDKVYSCYMMDLKEYKDTLIQDGDTKKDIFEHYEYIGENYGEYNYLLAEKCRDAYLQKMSTESIKVTLKTPLLALMRGHKVNFLWYINDHRYDIKKQVWDESGLSQPSQTTPIFEDSLPQQEYNNSYDINEEFKKDESISGQYMITGQEISYYDNEWSYTLTLNRPLSHKPQMHVDIPE